LEVFLDRESTNVRTALPAKSPTAQLAARLLRSSVCTALLRGKQVPTESLAAELASAAESSFVPKNAILGTCGCGQCEPNAPKETPGQLAERRERATDMSLENWVDFLNPDRTPNARTIEKILAIGVGPHFLRHIAKPHDIEPSLLKRCDYLSCLVVALYSHELTTRLGTKAIAKERRELADGVLRRIATRWFPGAKGYPIRTVALPGLAVPGMSQRYDEGWADRPKREQGGRAIAFRAATEPHRFRVEPDHVRLFDAFKPGDSEWLLYYLLSLAWAPGFHRAFRIVGTRWALDLVSTTLAVHVRCTADAHLGDLPERARRRGPARLVRGIAGVWSMLTAPRSLDIDTVGVASVYADPLFIRPDEVGASRVAQVQWHLQEARKLLPALSEHLGIDADLVRQAWDSGNKALPIPATLRARAPTTIERLFARVGISVTPSPETSRYVVADAGGVNGRADEQLDLLVNELAVVLRTMIDANEKDRLTLEDAALQIQSLAARFAERHAAYRAAEACETSDRTLA
jgi:hypothetical protein